MPTGPAPALGTSALGDGRTIAAIGTAPGRGALAIVRLSGPDVSMIAERLLRPCNRCRSNYFCLFLYPDLADPRISP